MVHVSVLMRMNDPYCNKKGPIDFLPLCNSNP